MNLITITPEAFEVALQAMLRMQEVCREWEALKERANYQP